MKTTDFAMIFIGILIPIIIVVYVDVAFMLESEEQKLYYINVINSAIDDATYAMKSVESEDIELDYGYSGINEKKVAINAEVAADSFFKSLYEHFEIEGDKLSEEYLKSHVPALAIIDYNGLYMYSIDEYTNVDSSGNEETYLDHKLKPKRYFSYMYGIKNGALIEQENLPDNLDSVSIYLVNFTMDDYVYITNGSGNKTAFYLEDNKNNDALGTSDDELKQEIIRHLKVQRTKTISKIVSEEMSYSVNAHNIHSNINYEFYFPEISANDWGQMVNNIGIIAFVQGINIGNDILDYTAHGMSALKVADRYYVSRTIRISEEMNYYHNTEDCSLYEEQLKPINGYYLSKMDAAALGYYPCPVCNP